MKVIGFRKKKDKKWLTHDTRKNIDERRLAIDKLLSAKSPWLIAQEQYKTKDKEVKNNAQRDKTHLPRI